MTGAAHRRAHGNAPFRIARDADAIDGDIRNDPCGQHDSARGDDLTIDVHTLMLDPAHGCGRAQLSASFGEHTCGDGRELLVQLRENARGRLEEMEAELVATDSWIEAKDV